MAAETQPAKHVCSITSAMAFSASIPLCRSRLLETDKEERRDSYSYAKKAGEITVLLQPEVQRRRFQSSLH